MIPRPRHFVDRFDPVMPGLQRRVVEENRTRGEIVLATDGGSAGDCFDERVASAGIAARDSDMAALFQDWINPSTLQRCGPSGRP